jgi:hypothetical protein
MAKRPGRKARVREWLDAARPGRIGEAEFEAAGLALEDIPPRELRRLLRDSGLPLDPLIEGVRQNSFEELARTLSALSGAYERSPRQARALVIEAKDHARLAARRLEGEARAAREAMVDWMLVWLENPPVFPAWLAARRRTAGS